MDERHKFGSGREDAVDRREIDAPRFDVAGLTEVGKIREHNEDVIRVIVGDEKLGARGIDGLYLVADGMGGHGAGEVASAIAVDVVNQQINKREFPRGVKQFSQLTLDERKEWLSEVVNQANHAIFKRRKEPTSKAEGDMGTTLVMAVRSGGEVAIANVGDSRAYMISADGKVLNQITRDHSLVASLVAAGLITADEARIHLQKNEIYRTMGDKSRVEADVFFAKVPLGGGLLLCSDGLWEMVEDGQIGQILAASGSAQEATRRLIEAANAAGGEDNISAIVVRNISVKEKQEEPAETGLVGAIKELLALKEQGDSETKRQAAGRALARFYNVIVDLPDERLRQAIGRYYNKDQATVTDDDVKNLLAAFAVEARKMKAKFPV